MDEPLQACSSSEGWRPPLLPLSSSRRRGGTGRRTCSSGRDRSWHTGTRPAGSRRRRSEPRSARTWHRRRPRLLRRRRGRRCCWSRRCRRAAMGSTRSTPGGRRRREVGFILQKRFYLLLSNCYITLCANGSEILRSDTLSQMVVGLTQSRMFFFKGVYSR
ncbi:hypothetical protein PVAP13_3KG446401 [Panicum virgatum]|uniref:Uncharacterized protein n=1 Tax=Panicum virgatum TaxID=38727 RepID=A0A8T0V8N7_PANVG|nr:hypothetical protein PVAP13_3KG446401 [Panicum virgatum]